MGVPGFVLRIGFALVKTVASALLLWAIASIWGFVMDPPQDINGASLVAAVYGGYFVAMMSPWSWLYLPYQATILAIGLNFRIFIIGIPMVGVFALFVFMLTISDRNAATFGFAASAVIASLAFIFLNSLIVRPKILEPLEYGENP